MKKSNVIPFPKKTPPKRGFESVTVLLSALETRRLDKSETKELSDAISAKVEFLDADLAKSGKALREGVESYLHTMAGDRQDELSGSGVIFKSPSAQISLSSGEAAKPESASKIELIVEGCISVAKEDVASLKDALKKIKDNVTLSASELTILKEILAKNTYWRFLEAT